MMKLKLSRWTGKAKISSKDVGCFGSREYSTKSIMCKKCSLFIRCSRVKNKKGKLGKMSRGYNFHGSIYNTG